MKDFQEELSKQREVALYACLTVNNFCAVYQVKYSLLDAHYQPLPNGQRREIPLDGWVRISEPVVVEFRGIDDDAVVRNAVESLNEQERKIVEELHDKLARIRERKYQLLALTHQVDVQ